MFNRVKFLLPPVSVYCALLAAAPALSQTVPPAAPEQTAATAVASSETPSAPVVAAPEAPAPVAAPTPARTDLPAPAPAVLDGFWKGPLAVPGGSLEVIFRLMKLTSGDYFATLDVPLQKVSHMEVQVIQHADSVVLFAPAAGSRFSGRRSPDGKQLVGTWQQPGFQAPVVLAFAAIVAPTAPRAQLSRPYREENIGFANAALRLGGMLTVPAGEGPFPAVVLVSDTGTGPHDRDGSVNNFAPLGQLADYLTRRGVAVLRVDSRGVGQSGGTFTSATATDLVSDVQAGLRFLRTRPEVDQAHLGVIGHGEGGNVALLAAAQPLPPTFVVALAAYGQPGRVIQTTQQANAINDLSKASGQVEAAAKRQMDVLEIVRQTYDSEHAQAQVASMLRQNDPTLDEPTAQRRAADLTSVYYRGFLGVDPAAMLEKVSCPVLLLNGTADQTVAAEVNLKLLARGIKTSKDVSARKLPGVNHLFQADPSQWPIVNGKRQPAFSPVAEEIIREWIVSQVSVGQTSESQK